METFSGLCFLHDPDISRRAIIFDMYGTLVKARFGNLDDIYDAFYRLFPDADREDVSNEYQRYISHCESANGRHREVTIHMVLEHLDSVFGTQNDSLNAEDLLMRSTHTFIPVRGAEETLRYFRDRDYSIGVLSNTAYRGSVVKGLLEDVGFGGLIDRVVSSADVGYRKPHDEAYSAAVGVLGKRAEDCFFVGDSEDKDFIGPRRFGMRGSFLIDPERPSRELGIVASIADVPLFFRD